MAVFPKAWPLWNFGASFGCAAAGLMDCHDAWGHQYVVMDLLGKLHNFSGRIHALALFGGHFVFTFKNPIIILWPSQAIPHHGTFNVV
jgi:hypothetical protein